MYFNPRRKHTFLYVTNFTKGNLYWHGNRGTSEIHPSTIPPCHTEMHSTQGISMHSNVPLTVVPVARWSISRDRITVWDKYYFSSGPFWAWVPGGRTEGASPAHKPCSVTDRQVLPTAALEIPAGSSGRRGLMEGGEGEDWQWMRIPAWDDWCCFRWLWKSS